MNRDLQIKYIKETYRGVHGVYPNHINLDHMEDDDLQQMFDELNEQYSEIQRQRQQDAESMSGFVNMAPKRKQKFF
jgi:hypothetical protein